MLVPPVTDRAIRTFQRDFRNEARLDLRLEVKMRRDMRLEAAGSSVVEGKVYGSIVNILPREIVCYYAPGEMRSGVWLSVVYPATNGKRYVLDETGGKAHRENGFYRQWTGTAIKEGGAFEFEWPLYTDYRSLKIGDCSWEIAPPGVQLLPLFPDWNPPPIQEHGTAMELIFSYYGMLEAKATLPSPWSAVGGA